MRAPDWRLALVLAAALILPAALPVRADISDRLRLSEAAAPERLRLRVHAEALAAGTLPARGVARMRRDMERQGFYFDGGPPALVASDLGLAPVLSWDGNVNGGVLQDRFVAGGLVFEAVPEARAVGAVVAGVQGFARARIAYDSGRLIELRGGAERGYAPAADLGRADAQVAICGQTHLTGWTFLDLCATQARYWRDLAQGEARQLSVEAVQVLATGDNAHQLGLRLMRVTGGAAPQTRAALSVDTLWPSLASRAALTFGESAPGSTLLRYRLEGGVSWLMLDRVFSLDLSRQVQEGGAFLGEPRRDRIHGVTLGAELRPGAELRLGLVDSRSTAAIADYRQVTLDLRLDSFR